MEADKVHPASLSVPCKSIQSVEPAPLPYRSHENSSPVFVDTHVSPNRAIIRILFFLVVENRTCCVNVVLHQESLHEELTEMIDRLQLDIKLKQQRLNVSTTDDYRSYYTSAGVELIARRHGRDFDLFGY